MSSEICRTDFAPEQVFFRSLESLRKSCQKLWSISLKSILKSWYLIMETFLPSAFDETRIAQDYGSKDLLFKSTLWLHCRPSLSFV